MRRDRQADSDGVADRQALPADYERIRRCTERLCEPLEIEDYLFSVLCLRVSAP